MASEINGKESSSEVRAAENDHIGIAISMLHKELSRSSKSFIFKVPDHLRQVNERAFEPRIISIGPYHRGKDHLRAMEIHKLSYMEKLLQRTDEGCLGRCIKAMEKLEVAARSCYKERMIMTSEEFVLMLVLDGCFVIELIRKFLCDELKDDYDDLFKLNFNLPIIGQELLLVENQLPFNVLETLFEMTQTTSEERTSEEAFDHMALRFFSGVVPGPKIQVGNDHNSVQKKRKPIKHLLGLVHDNWLLLPEEIERFKQRHETDSKLSFIHSARELLESAVKCGWSFIHSAKELLESAIKCRRRGRVSQRPKTDRKWKFIRSARELLDLGIKINKLSEDQNISLFDINFEKNRLYIPTLKIDHDTERIFRNFIAYEQFNEGLSYVTDYTRFMDSLINCGEDVALLSNTGIIENWLGSHEKVANMFNELNNFVYLSTATFYYSEIFNDVNNYCESQWTKWKFNLRRTHSQTPWDWIVTSIIVGSILLLLTLMQTIFTVLSYFKEGN